MLLLLVLLVELFLVLLEGTELVIGHGHGKASASTGHTSTASCRPSAFDDLHREPVGPQSGLCCCRWKAGGSRKRSYPLDHVRKVHPLGM